MNIVSSCMYVVVHLKGKKNVSSLLKLPHVQNKYKYLNCRVIRKSKVALCAIINCTMSFQGMFG